MRFGFTMKEIGLARRKFSDQMHGAEKRGIEFKFTFLEWFEWWMNTGKWNERGNSPEQYCMSRYGDIGPYEPSNVFCNTNYENCRDANLGRKHSDEVNKKKGHPGELNGFYGKTHTAESMEKKRQTYIKNKLAKLTSN